MDKVHDALRGILEGQLALLKRRLLRYLVEFAHLREALFDRPLLRKSPRIKAHIIVMAMTAAVAAAAGCCPAQHRHLGSPSCGCVPSREAGHSVTAPPLLIPHELAAQV